MASQGGVRLFLGPDRVRKLQRVRELERSLGIQPLDSHWLDAAAVSAKDLLALCRQQPAASPLRLVVVDDAHRLDSRCVEALLEHEEVMAKSALVLLLVEAELNARHAVSRLMGRGREAASERFVGRGTPAAKPFALTDALGSRDAAGALSAVREQLLAGKEPLELLGLIAWQLHRWVTVKRLARSGYTAERIVSSTGLHPWQAQRLQAEVAARSLGALQQLIERCWRLDVDAKQGRAIPELALDQLVVEICQPEADARAASERRELTSSLRAG